MFRTRLISGIILVILAVIVVSTGGALLYGVTAVISLVGMFELYRVMGIEKKVWDLSDIWRGYRIMACCGSTDKNM